MRADELPRDSTRFFARLTAGALECPHCGRVCQFGPRRPRAGWDAKTSRFTCPACQWVFILGLLAWPARPGGQRSPTLPQDHVPNERQLAELRAAGDGYWMRGSKKRFRPEDTNLTARCTCPTAQQINRRCPFHGRLAPDLPDT